MVILFRMTMNYYAYMPFWLKNGHAEGPATCARFVISHKQVLLCLDFKRVHELNHYWSGLDSTPYFFFFNIVPCLVNRSFERARALYRYDRAIWIVVARGCSARVRA